MAYVTAIFIAKQPVALSDTKLSVYRCLQWLSKKHLSTINDLNEVTLICHLLCLFPDQFIEGYCNRPRVIGGKSDTIDLSIDRITTTMPTTPPMSII